MPYWPPVLSLHLTPPSSYIKKGSVDEQAAVLKMYDPHCPDEARAFEREVSNYNLVKDLQGLVVPRLLLHGRLDFTGALFLALSNEGQSLARLEAVTEG